MDRQKPEWKIILLEKNKLKKERGNYNKEILNNKTSEFQNFSNKNYIRYSSIPNLSLNKFSCTSNTSGNKTYKVKQTPFNDKEFESGNLERLPLVKENPILLSDLKQKRNRHSLNLDSHSSSYIFDKLSREIQNERERKTKSDEEYNYKSNEERNACNIKVANNYIEWDSEIQYGKGFVVKILKKFNDIINNNSIHNGKRWNSTGRLGEGNRPLERYNSTKTLHEINKNDAKKRQISSFYSENVQYRNEERVFYDINFNYSAYNESTMHNTIQCNHSINTTSTFHTKSSKYISHANKNYRNQLINNNVSLNSFKALNSNKVNHENVTKNVESNNSCSFASERLLNHETVEDCITEYPRINQVKHTKSFFESSPQKTQSEMKSLFSKFKVNQKDKAPITNQKDTKSVSSNPIKKPVNEKKSAQHVTAQKTVTNIDDVTLKLQEINRPSGKEVLPDLLTSSIIVDSSAKNALKNKEVSSNVVDYNENIKPNSTNESDKHKILNNTLNDFENELSGNKNVETNQSTEPDFKYYNETSSTDDKTHITFSNVHKNQKNNDKIVLNKQKVDETETQRKNKPGKLLLKQSSNVVPIPLQPYHDIKKYKEHESDIQKKQIDEIVSNVDEDKNDVPITNLDLITKHHSNNSKNKNRSRNSTYYASVKNDKKDVKPLKIFDNGDTDCNSSFSKKSRNHSPPPTSLKDPPLQKSDSDSNIQQLNEKKDLEEVNVEVNVGVVVAKSILKKGVSIKQKQSVKFEREDSITQVFEYPLHTYSDNESCTDFNAEDSDDSQDDSMFVPKIKYRDSIHSDNLTFYKTKLDLDFEFEQLMIDKNNKNLSMETATYVSEVQIDETLPSNPFSSTIDDLLF